MRLPPVVLTLLVLAAAHVPAIAADGTDSTGWIAVTFQPPPASGEAKLVVDVPPASDVVIGYMVVRESRAPAGFAHLFFLDDAGQEQRWDMSSGVSPLLNSWRVDGDVESGLHMEFGITAKYSAAPTQIMVWVAGSSFSWTFQGAQVLSTTEGQGTILVREDDFTLGSHSLQVDEAFTGAFSTMPSQCAVASLQGQACVPTRACVFPLACLDLADAEPGTWEGPDGTSGESMTWTMTGAKGPAGWFTLASPGEYRFHVEHGSVSGQPVIVTGVDAVWRDPTIP